MEKLTQLVFDDVNRRVVSEDDEILAFYTEELECSDEIIFKVVELWNSAKNEDEVFGPDGIVDMYLLDAYCTEEDRELMIESLYENVIRNPKRLKTEL